MKVKDFINFLFKGEIPSHFQILEQEESKILTINDGTTEYVQINQLQIHEKAEIKLRSFVIKLFSVAIVILVFIIVAAMLICQVYGLEMPRPLEWAFSALLGCVVGVVATYMGVKQAEPIIVKKNN